MRKGRVHEQAGADVSHHDGQPAQMVGVPVGEDHEIERFGVAFAQERCQRGSRFVRPAVDQHPFARR